MMAKRGLLLHAIHFQSPPYTSDRALEKVETLCKIVSQYSGRIQFHCVPFTEIQEAIRETLPGGAVYPDYAAADDGDRPAGKRKV